jgi:hypothetical protein
VLKALVAGSAVAGFGFAGMRTPSLASGAAPAVPSRLASRSQGLSDAPWYASHGLDSDAYQMEFDALVAAGYRLLRLSGYSVDGVDYYASIWEQSPGPA